MSTTFTASETSTILRPAPGGRTHTVSNQPPERTEINEYTSFPVLREAVQAFGAGWADTALTETGAHVGTAEFQEDARLANAETPELVSFDHRGNRIDEVRYHPSYHRVIGAATAAGAHTSAWAKPQPGAHVARAATFSLFAQVEPGHACPISMTHAVVPALEHAPDLAQTWLPRLFGTGYDGTLRTPGEKVGRAHGHGDDRKAGRLRRTRQRNRRDARRGRGAAHGTQVVLLSTDV